MSVGLTSESDIRDFNFSDITNSHDLTNENKHFDKYMNYGFITFLNKQLQKKITGYFKYPNQIFSVSFWIISVFLFFLLFFTLVLY